MSVSDSSYEVRTDHHSNSNNPRGVMNFGGTVRVNPTGVCILAGIVFIVLLYNIAWPGPAAAGRGAAGSAVSLKELLSVGIDAARRGGVEVKRVRQQADLGEKSKGKTQEGANNPVTNGDMLSHRAMFWTIKKAFPGVNVISEEHDVEEVDLEKVEPPSLHNHEVEARAQNDMTVPVNEISVWIDPLDATQEYTENLLEYVTTMVCVAVNGKPVIGVIYKPFEDKTAWGWAGPNYVSPLVEVDANNNKQNVVDLSQSRIIVSRSHAGEVNKTAQDALGKSIKVTPAGGAGFKTWEVVKGEQDAYVHTTLIKKWDICAGNAILNALGGQLTTLDNKMIDYTGREDQVKNTGGVLATMHNHDKYSEKLAGLGHS